METEQYYQWEPMMDLDLDVAGILADHAGMGAHLNHFEIDQDLLSAARENSESIQILIDEFEIRLKEAMAEKESLWMQVQDLTVSVERLHDSNEIAAAVASDERNEFQRRVDKYEQAFQKLQEELAAKNEAVNTLATELDTLRNEALQKEKHFYERLETLKQDNMSFENSMTKAFKTVTDEKQRLMMENISLREELGKWDQMLREVVKQNGGGVQEFASNVSRIHSFTATEERNEIFDPTRRVSSSALGWHDGFNNHEIHRHNASYQFVPDNSLNTIPCESAGSLISLFESINRVNAAPEGYRSQQCSAYIAVVKNNGHPELYLSWILEDSRTALIYRPTTQPTNAAELREMIHDAIYYFESTGLMVEPVELNTGDIRENCFNTLPIFDAELSKFVSTGAPHLRIVV